MLKQNICFKVLFSLSLLLLLGVTACNKTSANTQNTDIGDGSSTEKSQTMVESSEAATDGAVGGQTEKSTDVALSLSKEGLLFVLGQSGKARTIPFDTDIETVTTAVSASLGEPTEVTQNSECPAGAMKLITWSNGLTINAVEGKFVGWTARQNSESGGLGSVNDISLGKTLTHLKTNYGGLEVMETTLGTEFQLEGYSGLLSANEPNGVVTNLWSGIACNFR